jgi:MFS family permease
MRKITAWEMLALNANFFGLSFMWNALHVILLPAILLQFVPDDQKNGVLGVLTGVGLVIAMIIQPLAGAASDGWLSRWGRRRPLILAGTLLDFVFLAVLALAAGIPGLAVGYIGLQFSSNTAHGPSQGLLPDRVPPDQLGRGSAVKSTLDMLGLIGASLLIGHFLHEDASNQIPAMGIVAAVLALFAALTLFGTHEADSRHTAETRPVEGGMADIFRVNWKKAPGFAGLILSRFVFLAGVYGIQAFAQYYVRDTLNVGDPVALTGNLMAVIALSLTVFAFGSGWLCDRFGRKPLHAAAAILVAGGSLLLIPSQSPEAVLLCGSIIGAGAGVFLTSNWALATDLAPLPEAGKFLGLTNLATAGAGALSRLTGPGLDWLNNHWPGSHYGYTALFISSAVFALLALFVLARVPEGYKKKGRGIPAKAAGAGAG